MWEASGFGVWWASRATVMNGAAAGCTMFNANTLNDFAEGSHLQLSVNNGNDLMDLMSWVITQFKTGAEPTIVRNAVVVANRPHPSGPAFGTPASLASFFTGLGPPDKPFINKGSAATTDVVDSLIFAKETVDVAIQIGTNAPVTQTNVPAGLSRVNRTTGGQTGEVTVTMYRAGTSVVLAQVTSATPINASYAWPDVAYRYTSSLRGAPRIPNFT